ncbi:MAG TPA: hypothetical protein VGK58_03540 [Lacipirellulaceae bacterium]
MRPRDWFSVGVRLLGVWAVYDGFIYLMGVLADRLTDFSRSEAVRQFETSPDTTTRYLVYAVGSVALCFILISGAERLTRWAFNEPQPAEDNRSEQPE